MSMFVLLALMLAPIAAIIVLRANGALVFAAICIGFTVTHYVSSHEIGTQLAPYIGPARDHHIQMILAFLPAVVILLCTLRSQQKGLPGIIANIFPALGAGFLAIALALPFLPVDIKAEIIAAPLWNTALAMQAPIIGFAALASLILLAGTHFRHRGAFER